MPRGSQKNSLLWRHFHVEERDKVSHRRKGHCLHCSTNFHDCRFELLQKHILYQCTAIPETLKAELGSTEVVAPVPSVTKGKRKVKDIETKSEERNVVAHTLPLPPTAEADLKAAADLVQATWRHFHIGPRDNRNHRRIAECTHCRGTCSNPRTERLQAHLLRFCKELPAETREQYRLFCEKLAVSKREAAASSGPMNAQILRYGALNESSSSALNRSFQTDQLQFGTQFQVKNGEHSASSSVSGEEAAATAPGVEGKVKEETPAPIPWCPADHFEVLVINSESAAESDGEKASDASGLADTAGSAKTDNGDSGSTRQPAGSFPVADDASCKFTCRYCEEQFSGTPAATEAALKDHILYACSSVPRERLSRLVESELTAPV